MSQDLSRPSFNIGIEEEYQTIDPVTRNLRSHISAEIVEKGRMLLAEHVKPGALAAMSRIRGALDPLRLLNRSVLF